MNITSIVEFLFSYAEDFWIAAEYSFRIFSVVMAWAITLGLAIFAVFFIGALCYVFAVWIKEKFSNGEQH